MARDFQATLGFYEALLDVSSGGAAPYAKVVTRTATMVIVDGRWWALASGADYSPVGSPVAPNLILLIQVPDIEEVFERMASRELQFLSPPTYREKIGLRNAMLRDPDGRVIMLTSPVP